MSLVINLAKNGIIILVYILRCDMVEIEVVSMLNSEIIDFLISESYRLYAKLKGIKHISPENTKLLKDKLKSLYICDADNIKIYVAYKEKLMIGCACITDDGYLRDLYVKEEYQHQGVGSLLLNRILYDIKEVFLKTYPNLTEFYRKNGFSVVKQMQNSIEMKKY